MKIAITGAAGLLGSHLAAALRHEHRVVGIDRHPLWGDLSLEIMNGDLEDLSFLEAAIDRIRPDMIIHCAAMLNVDACENMPERAFLVNGMITRQIVRRAGPDCLFVYVTTDGIFKGDSAFSTETDLPCPRTVYGRSKLLGEWEVQLATDNHLIIRTNFYGWSSGRKVSSAEWLFNGLLRGESLTLFDDFFFTPIYVTDLVQRLGLLISAPFRGTINVVGGERVSKYDFGRILAEVAGLSFAHVRRGSIDGASLQAPRPKDMSLSSERFCGLAGLQAPDCRSGLARFVADRGRPLTERVSEPVIGREE